MNAQVAYADTTCALSGEFSRDMVTGLKKSPKALPSKYFYDDEGSRLFDAICATLRWDQ